MKRLPALLSASTLLALSAMFGSAASAQAERSPTELLASAKSLSGAILAAETARSANDFGAAAQFFGEALGFDPENTDIQRELLIALITDGAFEDALPIAEKLKSNPQIERISRVALGVQAIRERQFLQAESLLILSVESDLERLLTGVMRSWAKFGAGEVNAALEALDTLEGPDWYELFKAFHSALIAEAAGRRNDSEKRFEYGMNNSAGGSASPQTYLRLAEAYAGALARSGQIEAAQAIIDRGLGIAPANPALLALKLAGDDLGKKALKIAEPSAGAAEILFNIGTAINRDGAETYAALYLELAQVLAPKNAQIAFELGGIAERLGMPEKAIAHYDEVAATSPFARIAHLQKGLNLSDLKREEEAKEALIAAVDEDPKDFRGYLALGGVHASLKEYEEAAALYERAIDNIDTNDSTFWPLYYRMGIAYERIKKWENAEKAFRRALELAPNQPDVLNYLGYSWIDMNINLEEGLEMIRKAVDTRPRDGYIVDSLGWAFYRLGRFEEAVAELEKATDLRPVDAIINDHLGDAYWRVGRKLEATYQWAQALDMEIEPEDAERIETKLQASNTPGEAPLIASSQVDSDTPDKTAASPDDKNGG